MNSRNISLDDGKMEWRYNKAFYHNTQHQTGWYHCYCEAFFQPNICLHNNISEIYPTSQCRLHQQIFHHHEDKQTTVTLFPKHLHQIQEILLEDEDVPTALRLPQLNQTEFIRFQTPQKEPSAIWDAGIQAAEIHLARHKKEQAHLSLTHPSQLTACDCWHRQGHLGYFNRSLTWSCHSQLPRHLKDGEIDIYRERDRQGNLDLTH